MGRPPKNDLPSELQQLLVQVGRNLKSLREEVGLTQAELARKSKISNTTLNEIETRHQRDIKLSTLLAFAKVLGVPPVTLLQKPDMEIYSRDHQQLLKASEAILKITKRLRPLK